MKARRFRLRARLTDQSDESTLTDRFQTVVEWGIFGLFQSPNNRTLISSSPKKRSGAASGMLGLSRLTGQSVGTPLVALLVRAGFAFVAALFSLARFRSFPAN